MPTQIYLISPPKINLEEFIPLLDSVLATSQIAVFQLRLKDISENEIITASNAIKPICHKHGIQFIINDSIEIAKKTGANGVHLGEDDGSVIEARKILGKNAIIGVSCYDSVDDAIKKAEDGADYVAFGAFFPTTTKQAKATPSPDIIKWWVRNATVPCVAIGGINADNCNILSNAGADFIAVISSVWDNKKGAVQAIMDIKNKLD